jgi:hypothetical protein
MMQSPAQLISVFVLLALSLGGCGQTGADREKRISSEQAAIEGYSSKIPEAIRYQTAFADEWRRVNEIKDLKAYAEGMRSRVIPALEKYVAALSMMPTNSPKLTEIHSKVTQAYTGAVVGFSVFLEELSDENVEERYGVLLKTMETVAHAEKTYRRHLGTYYAANRVLLDAPKINDVAPADPTPPAATETPSSP